MTSTVPGAAAEDGPQSEPPMPYDDLEADDLEAEDFEGLGELGVLPGLFEALDPGADCDFDDALSTCQ
ncbi:MAG: hypothetical protein AAGD06_21420 [Acidobacteriota bacterium]